MVAANSTAALTQRQESQIGSEIEVYIGQLSLGVNVFIYTDTGYIFTKNPPEYTG